MFDRNQYRYPYESDVLGRQHVRKGERIFAIYSWVFCRMNELVVVNDNNHLAALRENTAHIDEAVTAENHAQLDCWLTNANNKNMCVDAQSRLALTSPLHEFTPLSSKVEASY